MKFISDHFSQLLLFTILVIFLLVIWHMESINDTSNVNWAREQATLILGAIVGPIAQSQMKKIIAPADKPEDGEKPQ